MRIADTIREVIRPLFPGTMGMKIVEATSERAVATMLVLPA
jgi:hypothetical protein